MRPLPVWPVLILFAALAPSRLAADEVFLRCHEAPRNGLFLAEVDLTAAARWCGLLPVRPESIRAATDSGASLQFVPGPDFDARERIHGLLLARLPEGGASLLRLEFGQGPAGHSLAQGIVEIAGCRITHDPGTQGGLPSRLQFLASGKTLPSLTWQDRLYDPERGAFSIAKDGQALVTRIAEGPLGTAIQVAARFLRSDGTAPPSRPRAIYQWIYLRDQPLAHVTQWLFQEQSQAWKEAHFLECHAPVEGLPRWAGGNPSQAGEFQGTEKTQRFRDWALVHDGRHGLGMARSGDLLLYDGKGSYGPYLHAQGSAAWTGWDSRERRLSAWLWAGSSDDPPAAWEEVSSRLPIHVNVTVTVGRLRDGLEEARAAADQLSGPAQLQARRQIAVARRLEEQGRFEEARDALKGKWPEGWQFLAAGDLNLLLIRQAGGLRAMQLLDAASGVELLTDRDLPLFSLKLRKLGGEQDLAVTASEGWNNLRLEPLEGQRLQLTWAGRDAAGPEGLRVEATAKMDSVAAAIRWTLRVEPPAEWVLREVVFPQLSLADLGRDGEVVFPRGPGEVQRGLWQRTFSETGHYPSGWCSMQWAAAYDLRRRTGLYLALHDPGASTKDIRLQSQPALAAVEVSFAHPPPGLDEPGRTYVLPGEAVWQLLRGDWFDAARIYRDWVRLQANWWPKPGPDGRVDTPAWMRELPVWALSSGPPPGVVGPVKRFAAGLGVPVGLHWYNWHQIPFDNDYPHYFPTVDGFPEAVADLQRNSVSVMPYINGRLWDTRDRGLEDAAFSKVARPAAAKNEKGEPYLESYSSKEQDGSQVQLAAMCPATPLWQEKVREVVLRLTRDCGVKSVYIDQVAAASPRLCFDRSHGHPTGGGDWWTTSYGEMLTAIRKDLPPDRALTSECNAEPYAHVFDGFLTWHWQGDGQVPAFPAVYGGTVQMFGRAYRGGASKDLALRMKAGQQLVYGEQIGWLSPAVVNETENFAFLRQVVRLRWMLKRYFHAGEMARPPQCSGAIPKVTADWQWRGEWPVTTDALLTGAWALPAEQRLVLLFANVSDAPLSTACEFLAETYGLPADAFTVTELTPDGPGATWNAERKFRRELSLPARTARAWEAVANPRPSPAATGSRSGSSPVPQ